MKFFPLLGLLAFAACANQTPAQTTTVVTDALVCAAGVEAAVATNKGEAVQSIIGSIPACTGLIVDVVNGVATVKAPAAPAA